MIVFQSKRRPAARAPQGRRGFSLVEVAVTTVVLGIAIGSLSLLTVKANRGRESERLRRLAEDAVRSTASEVRATSSSALADPATWAAVLTADFGPGGTPGPGYDILGLTRAPGDPFTLTVQVITDETATDDALGVRLGLPRDLDGDGLATNTDVTASAVLLPIVVRVRWLGDGGVRQVVQGFYILGY